MELQVANGPTEDPGKVVMLSEPLPCGIYATADHPCSRPAKVAYLDPDPDRVGCWILRPVCRVCAMATRAVYGDDSVSETGESQTARSAGIDSLSQQQ